MVNLPQTPSSEGVSRQNNASSAKAVGVWRLQAWLGVLLAVAACGSNEDASSPPTLLPVLQAASPPGGSVEVPRTTWVVLRFDSPVDPKALEGFKLDCGGQTPGFAADPVGTSTVVINPSAELPAGASCTLRWHGPVGPEELDFKVAARGAPAIVTYDRADPTKAYPFPDDFWLQAAPSTPTGRVFVPPTLDRKEDVKMLLSALSTPTKGLDGFSPLAPFIVELPSAPDEASLPMDEAASLDPFASVGLFDIEIGSATFGERVPFHLLVRNHVSADSSPAHHLVIFASLPLAARGRYALVVTRRAFLDPTRPLEASEFFQQVAAPVGDDGSDVEKRASEIVTDALNALKQTTPPIRMDDVALAVVASIRSMDRVARDRLAMRDQIVAASTPTFQVDEVVPDPVVGSSVAAIVRGTCTLPSFRQGDFVARDANGVPVQSGTVSVPFVLALPSAAASGRVPIVMYQHGQPGSAEEVPGAARSELASAGLAVIGFTDIPNREFTKGTDGEAYALALFTTYLAEKRLPEWVSILPNAEQLAFLRWIPTLGNLDVLPLGAPDGAPELDPTAPLGYLGISQGAHRGVGLLPYAPEIRAAVLVVGGGRFSSTLVHQSAGTPLGATPIYDLVAQFFPSVTWGDYWLATAFAQMAADDQDELNQAEYLYKKPHPFGLSTHPSVLVVEGLGDSLVPVYSTRAAAGAFGIPQLAPSAQAVPFLDQLTGPLRGNVDSVTSAAFFQFVPVGFAGIAASPGCAARDVKEGHFCPQLAAEASLQRRQFLTSALSGVPEILAPAQ